MLHDSRLSASCGSHEGCCSWRLPFLCFIWYFEVIVFDMEARIEPLEGSSKAVDHIFAARGYRVVVFLQIIEKLRFLFCVSSWFLAASFVAVNTFCDLVSEVLRASFDQTQESVPKTLVR